MDGGVDSDLAQPADARGGAWVFEQVDQLVA